MYYAAEPHCPTHGKMHHSSALCAYICHGFDGEGCDYVVREKDLDWREFTGEMISFDRSLNGPA